MCSRKLIGPERAPHYRPRSGVNDDEELTPPRGYPDPSVSRRVPSLAGKTAVIVTDDRDMKIESVVTRMVMEDAGLGPESGPLPYSDFFSRPLRADVLILRSSREFSLRADTLVESLQRFRRDNPRSAVIVLTFEHHVAERLAPLAEANVVNAIEARPPCDDLALLRLGGEILGKLQSL